MRETAGSEEVLLAINRELEALTEKRRELEKRKAKIRPKTIRTTIHMLPEMWERLNNAKINHGRRSVRIMVEEALTDYLKDKDTRSPRMSRR